MKFRVVHQTEYNYAEPASESFAELRICPSDTEWQKVHRRGLELSPPVKVDQYSDYFGNIVEFFSIPFRHHRLTIKAWAEVETLSFLPPEASLSVSVAEARQIFNTQMLELYEFLQPSHHVPLHAVLAPLQKHFIRSQDSLKEALLSVNSWIYRKFKYVPGSTEISTPLAELITQKRGVCQDFAHLMLSILRTYGLPCRYVSGYIEAYDPAITDPSLIGATASHAWVEVFLPGGIWWGLDPTNNQEVGERHVRVAVGRDYRDVAPLRGTYKGAQNQKLQVIVSVKRRKGKGLPAPIRSKSPEVSPS